MHQSEIFAKKIIPFILRNVAISGLILSGCSALFTYIKTWILSSSFSSSDFGFYIYITTIIGWIVTIATSGLNTGLLGYLVSSNSSPSQRIVSRLVLALSFRRGLIGVFVAAIVFVIFLSPLPINHAFLYFSIILLIPISVMTYLLNSILIHQGKVALNNVINTFVLNGASVLVLLVINIIFKLNFYYLAVSIVFPAFLAFGLLVKVTGYAPLFRAKSGYEFDVENIVNCSKHMLASGILYSFWIKAESFFLNNACGSSCVAHFYIPYQFAFLLTMVNTVLYGIVSSRLSCQPQSVDNNQKLYNHASIFGYCTNFVAFMFIYINSKELLSIFGVEYGTPIEVSLLKLLSAAFLVYSYFGATAEIFLNVLGGHKYLLISAALTAALSLIANLILTFNYGVIGAAFSLTLTILSACWIRNFFVKKLLGVNLLKSYHILVLTVIAALIMELVLIPLNKLDSFQKIIYGNSFLLTVIVAFVFIRLKYIREVLKFIGMMKKTKYEK